jgi:hypothetical protein
MLHELSHLAIGSVKNVVFVVPTLSGCLPRGPCESGHVNQPSSAFLSAMWLVSDVSIGTRLTLRTLGGFIGVLERLHFDIRFTDESGTLLSR